MQTDKMSPPKQRFWLGAKAGLAAGVVATAVMLLLSVTWGGVSLPDVFGGRLTLLMPPSLFNTLHELIGGDAKHYFFYGIIVGQLLVFALSGGLFSLFAGPKLAPVRWTQALLLSGILWLFAGLILLPLSGAGIFGADLETGLIAGLWSLALVGLVFGSIFQVVQNWLLEKASAVTPTRRSDSALADPDEEVGEGLSRRNLLRNGALLAGGLLAGGLLIKFIQNGVGSGVSALPASLKNIARKIVPPPVPAYGEIHAAGISPEITSNELYYVVSKNLLSDPNVDARGWHLTVDGQVDHPFTLNYQELLAQPMQTQYESMMCISNEVGGEYMSNALWEGVPLKDLLQQAGVKPGATKVVFHSADDYSDSIHLVKALEQTTLLAVRMNNQTLPMGHGFPARMLVPGIYGMKHAKWITHIEVVNQDYQGYWQQRGWSDAAPINMTSRIDTPLDGVTLTARKPTYVAGVAFSGNRGISEVDVSFDGGNSWTPATLKKPLSNLTWVLWEVPWTPHAGTYTIVVHAVDMAGNVQDPQIAPPLPDGSTGFHTISVAVK